MVCFCAQHYDQPCKTSSATEPEQCVSIVKTASDSLRQPASQPTACHQSIIVRCPHRDFVGLESADPATRSAVISFSYHLTLGNIDDAFHAIRVVKWYVTDISHLTSAFLV